MIDPFSAGVFVTTAAGVIGIFLRIENRLTKLETTVKYIKENMPGCQQTLEGPTK